MNAEQQKLEAARIIESDYGKALFHPASLWTTAIFFGEKFQTEEPSSINNKKLVHTPGRVQIEPPRIGDVVMLAGYPGEARKEIIKDTATNKRDLSFGISTYMLNVSSVSDNRIGIVYDDTAIEVYTRGGPSSGV